MAAGGKRENCDFKVPCSKVKLNSLEAFPGPPPPTPPRVGLVFKMLAAKRTRASSLEKKHQLHICTFNLHTWRERISLRLRQA